jgi:opacity protein-like surface antigen
MTRTPAVTLTAVALAMLAGPARAADDFTTWYAGGAILLADLQFDDDSFDDDAAGGRVGLGYRLNRWFAVEGSWLQTTDFDARPIPGVGGGTELGINGFTLSAVGYAPVSSDRFAPYAKAGFYRLDQDLEVTDAGGIVENSSRRIDGLVVGAGLRARISDRVDMRAEGEWFDIDSAELWMLSLGVDYRFGAPR